MSARTAAFIASACDGVCLGQQTQDFSSVSIDTRTAEPGCAFFCLSGPNFDGHNFVERAIDAGARVVVAQAERAPSIRAATPSDVTIVSVADPERALGLSAAAWRRCHSTIVVGLTGSSGKTTTKEMISAVLSRHGATLATAGNLNNHLGVPLTLWRLEPTHQFAVVEMGMNHFGEIAHLAELTQPSLGVITSIGHAHTEGVGSLAGVAMAKGELLSALPDDGLAIIPSHVEHRDILTKGLRARLETIGSLDDDDVRLIDSREGAGGASGQISVNGRALNLSISLSGRHNLENACLAVAVGKSLGVQPDEALSALADVMPPPMRGEVHTLNDGTEVVLDCYNANPQSMRAAISAFTARHPRGTIALGDMLELGSLAEQEHRGLGQFLAGHAASNAVAGVGELCRFTVDGARDAGMSHDRLEWFSSAADAAEWINEACGSSRALLLKGSRGMRMERIFDLIKKERMQ